MPAIETEIRKLKYQFTSEIRELKKLICTRLIVDTYVSQDVACALLNVKPRQLRNIRKHIKGEKAVGFIGWKKGKGKNIYYSKADIEKYNGEFKMN